MKKKPGLCSSFLPHTLCFFFRSSIDFFCLLSKWSFFGLLSSSFDNFHLLTLTIHLPTSISFSTPSLVPVPIPQFLVRAVCVLDPANHTIPGIIFVLSIFVLFVSSPLLHTPCRQPPFFLRPIPIFLSLCFRPLFASLLSGDLRRTLRTLTSDRKSSWVRVNLTVTQKSVRMFS